jgi:uncharacterized membrane protein YccC
MKPIVDRRWIPCLFAAKTTASGLLALLIAFEFNLDQPKWALLTVFIVAQPQSGLVLAKSFYRIIGTVVGAAGALLLVSLFAQERVLFLGTLAIWIGLCTFASKHARNFAAYGFVLSGYTVAIVGITGALDPGNAFFIAVARVTEISLGIMTTAAISHLVFPVSLADSLRHAVAATRTELAEYAAALLRGDDTNALRMKLLGRAVAIENLRASAVFEDRDIADRSDALRYLDAAMLGVFDVAYLLGRSLDRLRRDGGEIAAALEQVGRRTAGTIELWRAGKLDTGTLSRRLTRARTELPLARHLYQDSAASAEQAIGRAAVIARLREFFAAFVAFAEAHDGCVVRAPLAARKIRFALSNDRAGAIWAGLRAASALLLVSTFWILADWPSGPTAAIVATVVTARLATMEHAVLAATGGALVIVLAIVPSFLVVEVLLPGASGFAMFALAVAPMLFLCAYLMAAHEKTAGLGFVAGLYFANAGGFQNRMAYDAVGFVNSSMAQALAIATAGLLFAIVAPESPEATRRRFVRTVRAAFKRITGRRRIDLTEFEMLLTEALDRLRRGLRHDRPSDIAAIEAGIALLGAGRELIRVRDYGRPVAATIEAMDDVVDVVAGGENTTFERARRAAEDVSTAALSDLRRDEIGAADARAAAREMVSFAAIRDELERGGMLLFEPTSKEAAAHAA